MRWDERHPDVFEVFRICKLYWFVRRLKMILLQLRSIKGVNGMTGFWKCYTQNACKCHNEWLLQIPDMFSLLSLSLSLSLRIVPRYFGVSVPKGGALTFALQGDVDASREFSTPARMCGKILSNIDYL